MEQVTERPVGKRAYKPIAFKVYKVVKKIIKYSIYIAIFYFAYKGFMAWV